MVSEYFSADYNEARAKFLDAAGKAGASIENRFNPGAKGPAGEDLYTDVARLGPDNARKVLVIISGTHGNEGFCGSGCQIGYLEEGLHKNRDEPDQQKGHNLSVDPRDGLLEAIGCKKEIDSNEK